MEREKSGLDENGAWLFSTFDAIPGVSIEQNEIELNGAAETLCIRTSEVESSNED